MQPGACVASTKLLEAHYNDAIPIDMLRTEQKRLDAELAITTRSLNALNADLTEADELIGIALDIAQHAGRECERAGAPVRGSPGHGVGEDAVTGYNDESETGVRSWCPIGVGTP